MDASEMHIGFKIEVDKSDSLNVAGFEPEEIDYWLNRGQDRFVKQRYGGTNIRRESFEETQKRTDDLREVIVQRNFGNTVNLLSPLPFDSSVNKPNSVSVSLSGIPDTYWFALQEECITARVCQESVVTNGSIVDGRYYVQSGSIDYFSTTYNTGDFFTGADAIPSYTDNAGNSIVTTATEERVEVKPMQHDDYNKVVRDPFNQPDITQLRRLMFGDTVELFHPENSVIFVYELRYIKEPDRIDIDAFNSSPLLGNCELADHTHQEIVELAANMALENIESRRYQTNKAELIQQE